jgi:hypothetical protein
MKHAVQVACDGMMYTLSFMNIGSGIQVILSLLPRQLEWLECWYHWWGINEVSHWDGLRSHDVHTKFHDDRFRHSGYVKLITSVVRGAAVLGHIYNCNKISEGRRQRTRESHTVCGPRVGVVWFRHWTRPPKGNSILFIAWESLLPE